MSELGGVGLLLVEHGPGGQPRAGISACKDCAARGTEPLPYWRLGPGLSKALGVPDGGTCSLLPLVQAGAGWMVRVFVRKEP